MEFHSHRKTDLFNPMSNILAHGALLPGTFLTWIPTATAAIARNGLVVAIHGEQVDVVWNEWEIMHPALGTRDEVRAALGFKNNVE